MSSPTPSVRPAVADVLGSDGTYRDPVWRLSTELTPLEQELLRCWWVRRLGFVAHAGAATVSAAQSYSRLEHSLGLLALTAHFSPTDHVARAAALLHDVGHLPLSHTFEGVTGLDHHRLGAERIGELSELLLGHGVDPAEVIATDTGERPSVLSSRPGALKLDHFESLVRSGRAHGRTTQPPPETLSRVRVIDGCVTTDPETGQYLAELVAGEARWLCSRTNVIPNAVVRHLAERHVSASSPAHRAEVAAMTDDEFWGLLLSDPHTASHARALRRDPAAWELREHGDPDGGDDDPDRGDAATPRYEIKRLYLDMPLVDGRPLPPTHPAFARLPTLPWSCRVVPPATADAVQGGVTGSPRDAGDGGRGHATVR